jgi:hypothetical protein
MGQHGSQALGIPPPEMCCVAGYTCCLFAGSVTGVGLEITYDGAAGSDIVVLTPTPGGPADKAGVKAGDVIMTVDGTPTKGLSLYDVSDLLQGEADSQVGMRKWLTGWLQQTVAVACVGLQVALACVQLSMPCHQHCLLLCCAGGGCPAPCRRAQQQPQLVPDQTEGGHQPCVSHDLLRCTSSSTAIRCDELSFPPLASSGACSAVW